MGNLFNTTTRDKPNSKVKVLPKTNITSVKEMSYKEYKRKQRSHVRPENDEDDDNNGCRQYRSDFD